MMDNKNAFGCFCAILIVIIAAVIEVCYYAYQDTPSQPLEPQIIYIEQVMEYSPGNYSVKYLAEGNELVERSFDDDSVKIIADVPENQRMYVLYNKGKSPSGKIGYMAGCEIHIHSAKEINGGIRRDEDKHGYGQTVVIEAQ